MKLRLASYMDPFFLSLMYAVYAGFNLFVLNLTMYCMASLILLLFNDD